MNRVSLRLRLAAAGTLAIILALALTAFGLAQLFATHVERRAQIELVAHLDQVLAGLTRQDGDFTLTQPPADPRFRRPYGGLYWQVRIHDRMLRSRSLWDQELALTGGVPDDGLVHVQNILGPADTRLLALEQSVELPPRLGVGKRMSWWPSTMRNWMRPAPTSPPTWRPISASLPSR